MNVLRCLGLKNKSRVSHEEFFPLTLLSSEPVFKVICWCWRVNKRWGGGGEGGVCLFLQLKVKGWLSLFSSPEEVTVRLCTCHYRQSYDRGRSQKPLIGVSPCQRRNAGFFFFFSSSSGRFCCSKETTLAREEI